MKIWLIFLTSLSLFIGLATISNASSDTCPFEIGKPVKSLNKSDVWNLINNFPNKKSQFETKEAFKSKQINLLSELGFSETLVFETMIDRNMLSYVAEEQIFHYNDFLFSNGSYGPSDELKRQVLGLEDQYGYDMHGLTHRIYDKRTVLDTYTATSMSGAAYKVDKVEYMNASVFDDHVYDEDAQTLKKISGTYKSVMRYYGYGPVEAKMIKTIYSDEMMLFPVHTVSIPMDAAEQFFNSARTYTAVKLEAPFILSDSYVREPKVDLLEERLITNYALKANIVCSALTDGDKKVVQVLTPLDGYFEYISEM